MNMLTCSYCKTPHNISKMKVLRCKSCGAPLEEKRDRDDRPSGPLYPSWFGASGSSYIITGSVAGLGTFVPWY